MLGSDKSETGGEDVMDDENDKVSRESWESRGVMNSSDPTLQHS